jgi:TPR repeat protein
MTVLTCQGGDRQACAAVIAPLTRACDAGSGQACGILGNCYAAGRGVKRDSSRARALREKACAGGVGKACYLVGYAQLRGVGAPQSDERALQTLTRACAMGDPEGCGVLAKLYHVGRGVPASVTPGDRAAQARTLYVKACRMGDDETCRFLHGQCLRGVQIYCQLEEASSSGVLTLARNRSVRSISDSSASSME